MFWFHYTDIIFKSCSLEYEYKAKLPSYEECMMAEPCKVKLDVEIHKAAAEKTMHTSPRSSSNVENYSGEVTYVF